MGAMGEGPKRPGGVIMPPAKAHAPCPAAAQPIQWPPTGLPAW